MIGLLDGLKLAALDPVAKVYPEVLGPAADKDAPGALNPTGGDHLFYTYLIPGAAWQALDGSQWIIEEITANDIYVCKNWWYPREIKRMRRNEIRKTIESWIDPVLQHVPPPRPEDLQPE
jgi:hypothetical protein